MTLCACCALAFSATASKADSYDLAQKYLYGFSDFTNNPYPKDVTINTTGTVTDHGISCTAGQNASVSLYSAFPSLENDRAFTIAMTFSADSLKNETGDFNLFSGVFTETYQETEGISLKVGYNSSINSFTASMSDTLEPMPGVTSMLASLPQGEALTILINQTGNGITSAPGTPANTLSISIFSGRTLLGTVDLVKMTGDYRLHDFLIGGGKTAFDLQGMGVIINGSLDTENGQKRIQEYFDHVGVPEKLGPSTPEPSSTLLFIGGGVLLAYRRRRNNG